MKRILESGQFSNYRDGIRLDSASREVSSIYQSYGMTTVFISHKHGVTASKIKERIRQCDKFILLATDGAVESKWCNWELGYGDSQKFSSKDIAILPLKRKGYSDSSYKGNEYMQIYPYISFYEGNETNTTGGYVNRGYYVVTDDEKGVHNIIPLESWLKVD